MDKHIEQVRARRGPQGRSAFTPASMFPRAKESARWRGAPSLSSEVGNVRLIGKLFTRAVPGVAYWGLGQLRRAEPAHAWGDGKYTVSHVEQDLQHRLKAYTAIDATERAHLDELRAFIASGSDTTSRLNPIGHLTASAVVIHPDGRNVLMTHHAKLGRWLQLGGHVESSDRDMLAAALREGREESGIIDLRPDSEDVFDVDVHLIPLLAAKNEPEHLHFDVRFLFHAHDGELVISKESNDLRWFTLDEALAVASDDSLARMVRKLKSSQVSPSR